MHVSRHPEKIFVPPPERIRVGRHLWNAEAGARGADVSHLPFLRRLVRALLLDELARYRRTGRFPLNTGFAEDTPCFVDIYGTPCAVAHLLRLGGETRLVARIARQRNHARVRELGDESRLVAWLAAAGLTVRGRHSTQLLHRPRSLCMRRGLQGGWLLPARGRGPCGRGLGRDEMSLELG